MAESRNNYDLILKNKKFHVPKIQETIISVSKKVADELLNYNQYYVISNVSENIFQNFIEFWKDKQKIPIIDHTNFVEYQKLNQEFGMLTEIIISKTDDPLFNILCLSNDVNCDKNSIERSIASNLDQYLEKYAKEMYQIPINSLYNIFKHQERILHNYSKACHFITQTLIPLDSDNINLFILAECLDGREIYKQSPELFCDFASKCSQNGFNIPDFYFSIISEENRQKDPILQKEIKELILSNNYQKLRDKINKEQITLLQIPDEITKIPDFAFFKCTSLQKVTTSMNLTSIGNYAFFGCHSLTGIFIPDSVEIIGKSAFAGCLKLEKVKIPKKMKKIEEFTFEGCSSLEEVCFHDNLEEICINSFYSCQKLKKLFIPDSVRKLTEWSFCHCPSIEEVRLPSNLIVFNAGIFQACYKLEKIDIPSSVTKICAYAFNSCKSLKKIVIPSQVKSIDAMTFANCSSLTDVSLPQNLESIKEMAFFNCSSLQAINLPGTLTSIEKSAFANCSKLQKIDLPMSLTSLGMDAFNSCSSLTKIQIPPKISFIDMRTFFNCTSLESVVFPQCNVGISCEGFIRCPNLKEIELSMSSNDLLHFNAFEPQLQIKLRSQ